MVFDLRLKDKLFIAGPSGKQINKNHNFFLTLLSPGCGKTTLIKNIIENITTFTSSPPNKVVYFYTEWQNKFDIMKASFGVEFIEDNDNMLNFIKDLNTSAFVIFDDMMNSDNLKSVAQIFLTLLSPGCGKTTLIKNIIENITTFTSSPPNKVVYFYTEWQNKFDIMKASFGVEFIEDNDNMLNFIKDLNTSAFVIFDDMMNSDNLKSVAQIFTVHGRHLNLSLAFLSQKLFNNNEHFRQISQNSDYMCVFKNPRNSLDIRNLSNQITPKSNALSHIYQKATVKPYSYIFINLTQEAVPQLKFINNIFSSDHIINAYVLTNCE